MSSEERMTDRKRLLDTAAEYVLKQRNKSYGEPDEDFQRIAGIWNALGFRGPGGIELTGHHVSMAMIALKMSRLTWNGSHEDSWIDIAGYAACGMETANLQVSREAAKGLDEFVQDEMTPAPELKLLGRKSFGAMVATGRLVAGSAHCLALPQEHVHDRECYMKSGTEPGS
jgi:hypothetical protein